MAGILHQIAPIMLETAFKDSPPARTLDTGRKIVDGVCLAAPASLPTFVESSCSCDCCDGTVWRKTGKRTPP